MPPIIRPNPRSNFKYTGKGNRVYQSLDEDIYLKNPHVALDGKILWDAIEICPKEGWVIVLEHTDGDNTNRKSAPKLTRTGENVLKTLYGKVEIGEVSVAHHN